MKDESPRLTVLRRSWRRWTEVVELFARGRRGRHRLRDGEYESLHRRLLRACRSLAGTAGEARRGYYRGLEDLARPWLTTAALARADREILLGLLARCRQAGRELGGGGWGDIARRLLTLVLAAGGAAGLGLVLWRAGWLAQPAAAYAQDVWCEVRWAVRQLAGVERWFAAGLLVVAVAMVVVWRAARD